MIATLVLRLILATTGPPMPALAQQATPDAALRTALYASPPDITESLPDGTPGAVSVVAHSAILGQGDRVLTVVRNGTDQPVSSLTVIVVGRDMSYSVVVSGVSPLPPVVLPPGGLTMVRVPLDGTVTPGMTADVTVTMADSDSARMDLAIPQSRIPTRFPDRRCHGHRHRCRRRPGTAGRRPRERWRH